MPRRCPTWRRNATKLGATLWASKAASMSSENWAYVADASGRGAYGQSGSILIPAPLAAEVLDRGVELAAAIDAYAGGHGIRDAQGAWGVLTRNLITRQDAFRIAVINAFAPFFNASLYRDA
ncbi:MAG: hypothetical protein DMG29_20350 [Acidobacteria bacterium]|nr:MAG: hypothetical protein DMG29_20350 [Acidobacteriota bacterium]